MLDHIKKIFADEMIDMYGLLSVSDCKIINQELFDRTVPFAKSLILFLIPYYTEDRKHRNISLYAVPKDYHIYVREVGEKIIEKLKKLYPDNRFVGMGDHSPIAETSAAAAAGLGIIGDNYRLINPKYGSYIFIAEIFTDIGITSTPCKIKTCNHCGICRKACPSPENCLSGLTQQKGKLDKHTVSLMKENNTAWGCDICQSVCPLNRDKEATPIEFFKTDRIFNLTPEILDSMSDADLKERAFGWRKRKTIERNIKLLSE